MNDHLSVQGMLDPRGGLHCFKVSKQNLNPFYRCIWCTKKWIRIEKVMGLQNRGVKNSKKQTTKHYKASFRSPKKFLVCCYVTIKVEK